MRPDNLLELFEINPAATELPRGGRPEPAFGSQPLLVEFDDADLQETTLLDPKRIHAGPPSTPNDRERLPLSVPLRGQTLASWGMAVGVYLVTLLLLLPWDLISTPPEQPIPVQLVIEQPPPPPPAPLPPPPKPEEKRPLGAIASVDMGQAAGKPDAPEEKPPPPPDAQMAAVEPPKPKPPPPEHQTEAVEPPKPRPPSNLTSALPKPTLPDAVAELPEPEPPPVLDLTPPPAPRPKQTVSARAPLNHSPTPHPTEYPGPAASRNEYLAYCESLIRRYSGMVSDSFLAGRRGAATLTLTVLGDGTIARVSVAQSSGYQDIDNRVEQMVAAVHRFPPLPQWFQGSSMPLMYHFAFPDRR